MFPRRMGDRDCRNQAMTSFVLYVLLDKYVDTVLMYLFFSDCFLSCDTVLQANCDTKKFKCFSFHVLYIKLFF